MESTNENNLDTNELKIGENENNADTNNYNHMVEETDSKYHLTLLTSYFLGGFGVHRFVNRKVGTGLLMLFTCGGCGIWWLIDIITILAGSFRNVEGNFIRSSKPFLKTWSNILVIVLFVLVLFSVIGNAGSESTEVGNDNSNNNDIEQKAVVEVTSLNSMTRDEIESWCEGNNIKCIYIDEYSDTISKGNFVSQDIATGEKINEGDSIKIVYSLGVKPPTEYLNALKKAESYSKTMNMSKAGIYDQLTSEYGENFLPDAAQYAIDNMQADWNANALAKAKSYSKAMNMSKAATYDQLTSEYGEQFTPEEAQYAIDNVVADWNANALAKAQSYQNTMNMSKAAIYDQLISEYGEQFTPEEAQYAIDNLN